MLCIVMWRVSLEKRVEYADEMMQYIMDSADNPMNVWSNNKFMYIQYVYTH